MTEEEKNDKLEELENLKIRLKFRTENRVLKMDKKFLEHVDDMPDEISRIEEKLKNEEQE